MLDRPGTETVCAAIDRMRDDLVKLALDPGNIEAPTGLNARRIEPLRDGVENAHQAIIGRPSEHAGAPECSMWRDINPYSELGIPSLTHGWCWRRQYIFRRGRHDQNRQDLCPHRD